MQCTGSIYQSLQFQIMISVLPGNTDDSQVEWCSHSDMTLAGSQFCPNSRLHARFMYLFHLSLLILLMPSVLHQQIELLTLLKCGELGSRNWSWKLSLRIDPRNTDAKVGAGSITQIHHIWVSSSRHKQENKKTAIPWPSSKQDPEDCCTHEDDGLRDTQVEEFLHSRL